MGQGPWASSGMQGREVRKSKVSNSEPRSSQDPVKALKHSQAQKDSSSGAKVMMDRRASGVNNLDCGLAQDQIEEANEYLSWWKEHTR